MSSDIVLTSALRSNLLSLQKTQSLIDTTQQKLATGLKVNSALDNPQSFFAAQSLNNRAGDLGRLLDGIGQSVQTIKSADEAIQSLAGLVDQAESLAEEAGNALDASSDGAVITGDVVFDGETNFTSYTNVDNGDVITLSATDANGNDIAIDAATGEGAGGAITISDNETVNEVIAQINAIKEDSSGDQVFEASLSSDGSLEIKNLKGGDFRADFGTNADIGSALGLGSIGVVEDNDGTAGYAVSVSSSPTLDSFTLYNADGSQADRSASLDSVYYEDSSGSLQQLVTGAATDTISIGVNGGTAVSVADIGADSVQGLIDNINGSSALSSSIEASFNENTNQVEIRAVSGSVESLQFSADGVAGAVSIENSFGFGTKDLAATTGNSYTESIAFGEGAGQLAQLENDYNAVVEQIDQLVSDAGYRGTNLLAGDSLDVTFNRDRTSSLTVEGTNFTSGSSGLDISGANFSSATSIASATSDIRDAQDSLRNFASSLSTSLSIIQNREDFTTNQINTLKEGADKLVVADQNEEGANLLALQTRQALGTTALSLASQSAQSVLRLF